MPSKVLGGRESVQVAVAQIAPRFLDPSESVARAAEAIKTAARQGANLVVFPETFLAGYPYWTEGWDSEIEPWRRARLMFRDAAIESGSGLIEELRDAARAAGVAVVMGFNEMDSHPAIQTVYNSFAVIGSDGALLGVHRKLMPTFTERLFWGRGDALSAVYETEFGRIGGLICGENSMILARAALIAQGEDIHVMLFPGAFSLTRGPRLEESAEEDGLFWGHTAARVHAKEAGCFVVTACGIIGDSDVPDDFPYKGAMNIDYATGGSMVVAPTGLPMVGPEYGVRIVHATCRAEQIKVTKAISDTMGHYARPDLLRLAVREGERWVRAENLPAVRERAKRAADRWAVDERDVLDAVEEALET